MLSPTDAVVVLSGSPLRRGARIRYDGCECRNGAVDRICYYQSASFACDLHEF